MNELILKLEKQAAELRAGMTASLTASQADGATPDDVKKHLGEYDGAEARLKDVEASLSRAVRLRDADATAVRHAESERQPARDPIVGKISDRNTSNGAAFDLPAAARRHGPLVAFKGADAAKHAYQAGIWAGAVLFDSPGCKARLAEMGMRLERDDTPSATLNTLDNGKGGYFVPAEMDRSIVKLIAEDYGLARRLFENVPMGSDTKDSVRWTGGMVGYWIAEGQAPLPSDPAFDQIKLVAKKLGAMTKITDELDEDGFVDWGDQLTDMVALAFAEKEDAAGFNGDGTSQFGGIVGLFTKLADAANAASVVTAAAGRTTPQALTQFEFQAVLGKYPNYPNARNRKWMVHQEVWAASMLPLQLAAGGATPADIRSGGQMTFLGYPVEIVNSAPNLAAATTGTIPIAFGDPKLSTKFGDRRTNRTLKRGYVNDDFSRGLTTLIATERLDIVTHTVTDPRSNGTKAGPVVGLKLA